MNQPSTQQQLIELLTAALQLPALPVERRQLYRQMLGTVEALGRAEPDAETEAALQLLLAQVRAEVPQAQR